jgi:hypothetical protein
MKLELLSFGNLKSDITQSVLSHANQKVKNVISVGGAKEILLQSRN